MLASLVSLALCLVAPLPLHDEGAGPQDTALLAVASCLAKGGGNCFLYHTIWKGEIAIQDGDVLHYDVFLGEGCPSPKGGIDLIVRGGTPLRDTAAKDGDGLRAHGDALLTRAVQHWLHRAIDLAPIAGKTVESCQIVFEGDPDGTYVQVLDRIEIRHKDGATVVLYGDGDPQVNELHSQTGYSHVTTVMSVPRARVRDGESIAELVSAARELSEMLQSKAELQEETRFVSAVVERAGATQFAQDLEAAKALPDPQRFRGDPEGFERALHQNRRTLEHTHPLMKQYSGHLVGHAHIDFQWLWEWPETIEVCKQTFGQAVKFMDEYEDFTFTQSSAALYVATEENHPEIFAKMQQYAKEGRWDIAGGRWCEGDTNMISAESHARHFLYGQRYFRDRLGKTATVGWEPDTFGHVATFPQMLRAAGMRFYYFCRGGKGIPLFWWQGPDGSRVLAFDEPATGSWYNSDVNDSALWELLKFQEATGLKDLIWVYGVGNHGGGPTRENIERALDWQRKDYLPNVKFATADEFFTTIEKCDLSKLPVVNDELNPVFEGCYTTHGDIKRWNRDAERWTEGAEALSTAATLLGASYPKDDFRKTWTDVLWNHHHDTLPGTSIHPSYGRSAKMYEAAIARSEHAHEDAERTIASHMRRAVAGTNIVVVNDLPWARDGLVSVTLPAALASGAADLVVADAAKSDSVAQITTGGDGAKRLLFLARAVPSIGARSYAIGTRGDLGTDGHDRVVRGAAISADGSHLETSRFVVELDPKTALVTRLFDKAAARETIAPGEVANVIESHLEEPHGMSAWVIGKIVGVERLDGPAAIEVLERGPVRVRAQSTRRYRSSTITQEIALTEGLDRVDFTVTIDWHERGSGQGSGNPFLKVAFPVNVAGGEARYELPFGDLARKTDGKEWPALKWVDLSGGGFGVSLLNDCKHGHSVDGHVMRLSLVRSSYYPDPEPDQYVQKIAYSLVPHRGDFRDGHAVRQGFDLNRPLAVAAQAPADGDLGTEASFLRVEPESVVLTALKVAEDDGAWIARVYESAGRPATVTLTALRPIVSATEVNLIEDPVGPLAPAESGTLSFALGPYQIRTVKLTLRR